jgi:tartrate-resistant acid phosphatase type 5
MNRFSKRRVRIAVVAVVCAAAIGAGVGIQRYLSQRGCLPLAQDVVGVPALPDSRETVRFLALGDTGTGDEDQRRVARAAARLCREQGCDFLVLLGDNFYESGVTSPRDAAFTHRFEEMYGGIGKPVFAVLGNHDVRGDALAQVQYSLRSAAWRMPNFSYAFRAGPARFLALNTTCQPLHLLTAGSALDEGAADWTFVLGHHTLYSSGYHGDTHRLSRWYWQSNLAGRVDFYLAGHDHELEHLRVEGGGTDYIVSGAGGKHYRDSDTAHWETSSARSLFVHRGNGLVGFEVSPARVRVRFYDGDGAALYGFVKEKP